MFRTTCGNCQQKLEVVAADAVLVPDFAGLLVEALGGDPAKSMAAVNARLKQEQQGLFDKVMELRYVTKEQKARAVSSPPVIAHSNLGGVSCRVSRYVRATRSLIAGNVVKARLGRKTTTARKVGTVVAVPLAMLVGGMALKLACGACCGNDASSDDAGGPGAGGGGSGGFGGGADQASAGNGAADQQLEDMRSATRISASQGAARAAADQAAFSARQAFDLGQMWLDNPQEIGLASGPIVFGQHVVNGVSRLRLSLKQTGSLCSSQ